MLYLCSVLHGHSWVCPPPRVSLVRAESHTMLGEIHRLACSIDLQVAPVDGDSWLTSTLIDFVAFHFARHYPDVHFLPTNFALVDLPSAVRDPVTLSVSGPVALLSLLLLLPGSPVG